MPTETNYLKIKGLINLMVNAVALGSLRNQHAALSDKCHIW